MRKIGIIGFGKIGQAIAASILKKDIEVIALDTDASRRQVFADKKFETREPGIKNVLTWAYADKKLIITDDYPSLRGCSAVIIAIPLGINDQKKIVKEPFLNVFHSLKHFLENGTVVVTETSLPVGFSRKEILPVLESGGKQHGIDFYLAYSPERIKSGTMLQQLSTIPKVVGGINPEATKKAHEVYQWFINDEILHPLDNTESAELLKLSGMLYRDINIALSNQLAAYADRIGVNFADMIPLINADNEAGLLQPGIGVGGHCTPVYPYFLIQNFGEEGLDFLLAKHTRQINDQMADYAIRLIADKVTRKTALILGLGFRPQVNEDAHSVTYLLRDSLVSDGFEVRVHDPFFTTEQIESKGLTPVEDVYSFSCEVVFLVTMHPEYAGLDFSKLAEAGVRYLVDGRNRIDRKPVEKAGITYFGIGR
jgi:nucleotide sugar dehydrogenase